VFETGRNLILGTQGYALASSPLRIVDEIVAGKRKPDDCAKFKYSSPIAFGPPEEEQRKTCYFEVAKGLQDPSVCERLMPSEYGIRCLAEIRAAIEKDYCAKD